MKSLALDLRLAEPVAQPGDEGVPLGQADLEGGRDQVDRQPLRESTMEFWYSVNWFSNL